jgi:hypothetical protein
LVCNSSNHSKHCPSYNYNNLKGASVAAQQTKQLAFNQSEINLLSKSLELCRYFITRNATQFQQSKDILNDINSAISIISARQNNNNNSNLKGASSNNNICTKKEHLKDLLRLFNLI